MAAKNVMEMYSTHNKGKSLVAERCNRTLKNKIYKNMTPLSKHVYIDKLGDIVKKYNNKYHGTIKMRSVDVKTFLQKAMFQIGLKKFL